jgi:ubiquinone/menaquinone biosynthesis C-methylase UbiE
MRRRMPYDDNSFDTVLHFETFAHISYPAETEVSEISRVSKPKGNVFLSVPSSDLRGCEKRSFSKKELKEILVQHGLKPKIRTYTAGELGIPNVLPDTKVTLFAECLNTKI